jgi:hypothetical protein
LLLEILTKTLPIVLWFNISAIGGGVGSSKRPAALMGDKFISGVGPVVSGSNVREVCLGSGNAELGSGNTKFGTGNTKFGNGDVLLGAWSFSLDVAFSAAEPLIRRIPIERTADTLFISVTVFATGLASSADNDIAPYPANATAPIANASTRCLARFWMVLV